MTALIRIPAAITAGDSVDLRLLATAHPADQGWALRVDIAGPAEVEPWTSTADGGAHVFAVAAAETEDYTPGLYSYQLSAHKDTRRVTLERGQLTVHPNLAAVAGSFDGRSPTRQILDAIEARLLNRATQDQMSLSVAGRSINRISLPDLLTLREAMRKQLAKEEGRLKSRQVFVKYGH